MKTIKSLITFLLLTIAVAVQAQTVVIEKTDGTSDEYELSDIDSIAYEPTERYFYYLGTYSERPTTLEDLKSINTTYTTKPTTLTIPAGTTTAQAWIYPAEWGQAYLIDPTAKADYGNKKDSPFDGYNMTQFSSVQTTASAGEAIEIHWATEQ